MAIIALRAWYLESYEPLRELERRPHDLRLSKNSLLKSALRADFLDDLETVKQSAWFARYLDGETVEFYIEGSGGYAIANIDLNSQEIYFTKRDVSAQLEPTIFLALQSDLPISTLGELLLKDDPKSKNLQESSLALRQELTELLEELNTRSRIPLTITELLPETNAPLRPNAVLLRQIRRSLLFIADGTAIDLGTDDHRAVLSPAIGLTLGYALGVKKPEQILVIQQQGRLSTIESYENVIVEAFPFDLPSHQHRYWHNLPELRSKLQTVLIENLRRFRLWPEG